MKLKLYFYYQCPYCLLVIDKIEQLNISDKIEFCNILENNEFRDQLINKTGRKTVPCLFIDGEPLFESRDIVKWFEKNYKNI